MSHEELFTPKKIGSLTIKNRLVMTAAGCELTTEQGEVTEAYLAYYEARAKGGVGAVITELMQVNPTTGVMNRRQVRLWRDDCIPQLRRLAERMHAYDCRVFIQLQHPGNVANSANLGGNTPVSASDVSNLIYQQPVRPMTAEEIHELVGQFGDAARRAKEAGIDGVELHAAHFYLLHQFLSPYFNHRTDEYGGSHENRMRILREVLADIRAKVGKDYPVLVRVSAEEYLPAGGYHLDEGIEICRDLEKFGADALNITVAGTGCRYGQSLEPISFREGWRKHVAAGVKKFVSIPVIGVADIRSADYAERMITDGYMDFVGSARNYIADPDWADKVRRRDEGHIRRCISCLRCIQGIVAGESISCSVNPACGRETETVGKVKTGGGRKVVVLGGGPAGMEAAATAAEQGFSVTLFEESGGLGGQLRLAAQAPNKGKIEWFVDYLTQTLRETGVEVRIGEKPTPEELKELSPCAVIDATGALPIVPRGIQKGGFVLTPDQVLGGEKELRDCHAVIVGSGMTGLETAEYLTARGNMVTIVEMAERIAPQAYGTQIADVTKYLDIANTVIMTSTALDEIRDGYITIRNVRTGRVTALPCDYVILSLGVRPSRPYGDSLAALAPVVLTVGDAQHSGRIIDAVRAGYDAARELE